MKNLLGSLIIYLQDLGKFNFNMNFKVYYYPQIQSGSTIIQQEKVITTCIYKSKVPQIWKRLNNYFSWKNYETKVNKQI